MTMIKWLAILTTLGRTDLARTGSILLSMRLAIPRVAGTPDRSQRALANRDDCSLGAPANTERRMACAPSAKDHMADASSRDLAAGRPQSTQSVSTSEAKILVNKDSQILVCRPPSAGVAGESAFEVDRNGNVAV
jgi:hypothetical protein